MILIRMGYTLVNHRDKHVQHKYGFDMSEFPKPIVLNDDSSLFLLINRVY